MQTAALAGVDVRLMLPYRVDNRLTHLAPARIWQRRCVQVSRYFL